MERARDFFRRGEPLAATLPEEIRPDIELFSRGGLAILEKIERHGYNVWQARPVLSKWDKVRLMLGTFGKHVVRSWL